VERYVLYTGVLRTRKGLFDLLECARYVCRRRSDARFLICGNGPLLPKLNEKIRKLELQERVVLLGHVSRSDLVRLYQNATVHVVPSHYEGLPTVLLEAMSCALPVVATNVGGTSEVISNGSNGFLVPPKSPERMSEHILRLLDDDTLREEIGKAARKTILEHYTWNTIADNVTKCYEDILP
jgi:glycosyltransferase involved in cell wall biosynthesis